MINLHPIGLAAELHFLYQGYGIAQLIRQPHCQIYCYVRIIVLVLSPAANPINAFSFAP